MVWTIVTSLVAATVAANMLFQRKRVMTWRTFAFIVGPLFVTALITDLALGGGFARPTGVAWVLIAISIAYVPYGFAVQRVVEEEILRQRVHALFDRGRATLTREAPVVTRELPAVLWILDGSLAFFGLLGLVLSVL